MKFEMNINIYTCKNFVATNSFFIPNDITSFT